MIGTGHFAVGLSAIVVLLGVGQAFLYQDSTAQAQSEQTSIVDEKQPDFVHVDELAKDPHAYPGEIVLRAVVAKSNESEGVVSVIDSREFESCGQLKCAENYLPVKISGSLPEPRTLLFITGQVVRDKQGLVFQATQVKKVQ